MPPTYSLLQEQSIPRSIHDTFSFFEDAANLQTITPASLDFRILTPLPITMESGTLIDYHLKLLRIPFRWRTKITEYDPPSMFVDEQIKGPYQLWRHRHEFKPIDSGTLMVDRVDYQIGWSVAGSLAHTLFVKRTLDEIFSYRRRQIEKLLD